MSQYLPNQKVDLLILRRTDLGFVAKINGTDEGLLYHSEIFEILEPGQELAGYINRVRADGSIDLLLQPFGNFGTAEIGERILQAIAEANGFLAVTDKTSAEKIYDLFGVSKKKFKMALGGLYKARLITVGEDGIRFTASQTKK